MRMNSLIAFFFGIAAAYFASDWGFFWPSETEKQQTQVERYFSNRMVGTSGDQVLVKYGTYGRDPVAIIYGFLNDGTTCGIVAKALTEEGGFYRCETIN